MYGLELTKRENVIYARTHSSLEKKCKGGMKTVYPGCQSNKFNDTLCSETAVQSVTIKCAKTRVMIQEELWENQ